MARLLFAVACASLISGCSFSSYAGVSLAPGGAPRHLASLAHKAMQGDRRARYALGSLYEGGQGVVRNLVCAARLYEAAGAGPEGLPEARNRLESIRPLLEQEADPERAARWCGSI